MSSDTLATGKSFAERPVTGRANHIPMLDTSTTHENEHENDHTIPKLSTSIGMD
jgi:hypothetical protein